MEEVREAISLWVSAYAAKLARRDDANEKVAQAIAILPFLRATLKKEGFDLDFGNKLKEITPFNIEREFFETVLEKLGEIYAQVKDRAVRNP